MTTPQRGLLTVGEQEPRGESGTLAVPALVVHGGAGSFERARRGEGFGALEEGLEAALDAGWRVLAAGGSALDAAVEAVASLEDSGRFNAGRGAVPTSDGDVELDAGVMDARSGVAGAVAVATWPANPVRVARALADLGVGPHGPVLLAGPGADRFAASRGLKPMSWARLTGLAGADDSPYRSSLDVRRAGDSPQGTVGAVAIDVAGGLAAATSTGGRSGQMPGRVGDSPIPGAGVWAADDVVAVSATGAGEAFVLAGFGHRVDWNLRAGSPLLLALDQSLAAVASLGATGGGIALAPGGAFAARFTSEAMARGWRDAAGTVARVLA